MFIQCKVLDKNTNSNFYGQIDDRFIGNPLYSLVEIPDDGNVYIWDDNTKAPIIKPIDISVVKEDAHATNKSKHELFLAQPFTVTIVRDLTPSTDPSVPPTPRPNLNLILDCTDNTRFNILSAYETAKELGSVYFYDGLGNGDTLSLNEMKEVVTQFFNKINPSFKIKGTTKLAINNATTQDEINAIISTLSYN